MKIRHHLIWPFIFSLLLISNASADTIYQWTDEDGSVNFSNRLPTNVKVNIAYQSPNKDKAFYWVSEEGGLHLSDTAPLQTEGVQINEVEIERFNNDGIDKDEFSIVNQAERLAELREKRAIERFEKQRLREETFRAAEELEELRLNKQLREWGYGPKPFGFNSFGFSSFGFSSFNGHFSPRFR